VATIEERLRKVVSTVVAVEEDEFTQEASLVGNFNADSFDLVRIAMEIEDEFHIEIPPDDMTHFTTIREITDYIETSLQSDKRSNSV
jgi:acyl carrier protein